MGSYELLMGIHMIPVWHLHGKGWCLLETHPILCDGYRAPACNSKGLINYMTTPILFIYGTHVARNGAFKSLNIFNIEVARPHPVILRGPYNIWPPLYTSHMECAWQWMGPFQGWQPFHIGPIMSHLIILRGQENIWPPHVIPMWNPSGKGCGPPKAFTYST